MLKQHALDYVQFILTGKLNRLQKAWKYQLTSSDFTKIKTNG